MAMWRYAGWIEAEGAERVGLLRKHIREVSNRLGGKTSMSFDGGSWSREGLEGYLKHLTGQLALLDPGMAGVGRPVARRIRLQGYP